MLLCSAVSYRPDPIETGINLLNMQNMCLEAANIGSKIVVFPELALGGQLAVNMQDAYVCSQNVDGFAIQEMIKLSQRLGIYVAFGYIESSLGLFYNSVCVVGPSGLLANIRKSNLNGKELLWAKSSEAQRPILNLPGLRVGVLSGKDLEKNTYSGGTIYEDSSVDLILSPNAVNGDYLYPNDNWVDTSLELQSAVIVANRWGQEYPSTLYGGACVIDSKAQIFSEGNQFQADCIVYGEI